MKTQINPLGDQEKQLLLLIASVLRAYAYDNAPLKRSMAAEYSQQLQRLTEPTRPIQTVAERRAFAAALSYEIRMRLVNRKNWKRNRARVAKIFGYKSDLTVSTFASKWKVEVDSWLDRIKGNCDYNGLTPKQMLQRERQLIEPPVKRKSRKSV